MTTTFTIWVIYEHPIDYPNNFVVRPHDIYPGKSVPRVNEVHLFDSLQQCRNFLIPKGCERLPRDPSDEPQIVESWV